ncbi:hypothetical protein STENM327S_07128 [Streptomyces tendae]
MADHLSPTRIGIALVTGRMKHVRIERLHQYPRGSQIPLK